MRPLWSRGRNCPPSAAFLVFSPESCGTGYSTRSGGQRWCRNRVLRSQLGGWTGEVLCLRRCEGISIQRFSSSLGIFGRSATPASSMLRVASCPRWRGRCTKMLTSGWRLASRRSPCSSQTHRHHSPGLLAACPPLVAPLFSM